MGKQLGCGAIFAGAILVLLFVMAFSGTNSDQANTTNTIIAAHNACEAQTGKRCD